VGAAFVWRPVGYDFNVITAVALLSCETVATAIEPDLNDRHLGS